MNERLKCRMTEADWLTEKKMIGPERGQQI